MKQLQVYDDDHSEIKAQAAKAGRTIPKMVSAYIRFISEKLNSGELETDSLFIEETTSKRKESA